MFQHVTQVVIMKYYGTMFSYIFRVIFGQCPVQINQLYSEQVPDIVSRQTSAAHNTGDLSDPNNKKTILNEKVLKFLNINVVVKSLIIQELFIVKSKFSVQQKHTILIVKKKQKFFRELS